MLSLNQSEMVAAIVDSNAAASTTFAIGVASVASTANYEWARDIPLYITCAGGIVAFCAGIFLMRRHWSKHKLNVLLAEKTQLEIDMLKKEIRDV